MSDRDIVFDFARTARIGLGEAVFCEGKTAEQIAAILEGARERGVGLLLTRLDDEQVKRLPAALAAAIDYCPLSRTGFFGPLPSDPVTGAVAVVSAGTADAPVAREAARTLRHGGVEATAIADVGVAGLWRLMERIEEIARHPVVIVVAGMDGALASVLGGLVPGAVIAVPTSTGYGAAEGRAHGPQCDAGKLCAGHHRLQHRQWLRRRSGGPAHPSCDEGGYARLKERPAGPCPPGASISSGRTPSIRRRPTRRCGASFRPDGRRHIRRYRRSPASFRRASPSASPR